VALLGAKAKKIKQVKEQHPDWTENEIINKLVAYCSCEYIAIILQHLSLICKNIRDLDQNGKNSLFIQIFSKKTNLYVTFRVLNCINYVSINFYQSLSSKEAARNNEHQM